jgi:plastocyanin
MTWGLLLRVGGAKTGLLLIAVGIALRDKEAVVIGAGMLAGVALVSFRSGLLGRLVLLGLSIDVLAWMATAAIANVADGEDVVAVAVPLALTMGAATTAVAALCDLLRARGRSVGGHRTVVAVAALAVAVFVVGLGVAQLGGFGSPTRLQAGDVRLAMKDAKFGRDRITVPAGQVSIVVENDDLFWHTFTIDTLHVDSRVPVKARRRATFTVAPGTYTYYCAIPGHRAIGMEGTLTVHP